MRRRKLAALVLTAGLLTASCGLETSYTLPFDVEPGSIQPIDELKDLKVTVGSKDFTENIILGYIAAVALSAAGADVQDLTNIQGSNSSRQALLTGDTDLSWDYTGTGWISYLGKTEAIRDEGEQYEAVRKADLAENNVVWLPYSPINNTYAFATTPKFAQENNLKTTSDMAALIQRDPSKGIFCLETEFISRDDGFPGVAKTYGFDAEKTTVKTFGTGTIYSATATGGCNFGEVFTTDGRIKAMNLTVMADDRHFFPNYNVAPEINTKALKKYPAMAEVLEPITKKLNNTMARTLNAKVDVDGEDPHAVAKEWMVKEGFIKEG